jgi:hypothetical protein
MDFVVTELAFDFKRHKLRINRLVQAVRERFRELEKNKSDTANAGLISHFSGVLS